MPTSPGYQQRQVVAARQPLVEAAHQQNSKEGSQPGSSSSSGRQLGNDLKHGHCSRVQARTNEISFVG